ncbi:MAG: helicase-related protein [Gemmatimonadaceae bacterium]
MDGVKLEHPDVVRSTIAAEWLRGDAAVSPVLGAVTLRSHQVDAVSRLRLLLALNGGALLCDEVGLGKTYVALAVARLHERPLVVAPASLRGMWESAAARSGVAIRFASTQSLSRALPPGRDHDLVIVDEAHHFRTPATARHRALATLTARSPVLLVSATPVHNKKGDLTALLSLFLGSAARRLSKTDIARHLVRRNQAEVASAFPHVRDPMRLSVPHETSQLDLLLALPPPTPARDGGFAGAIIVHTLVRLWASSDAALREGLRRRLGRTVAIRSALEGGRYPTSQELQAWTYGEGSVQLGFAAILSPDSFGDCERMLRQVRRHERALVELLASLRRESGADAARVEHVRMLRRRHAGAKIVAFSQLAETVALLYRRLSCEGGVAMLTARGARIASGPIRRNEALARFAPLSCHAPPPARREEISLLIATDLLSEGVNLQDAAVVIHLDLPWTAATLEQRVGRVARLGSRHDEVFVYALEPPAPSRALLKAEAIIRRKAELAGSSVGSSRIPPLFARAGAVAPESEVEDAEAIRRTLAAWAERGAADCGSRSVCAAVIAPHDAALVLVTARGQPRLLAAYDGDLSLSYRAVREIAAMAHGQPAAVLPARVDRAFEQAHRWIELELAADDAGQSWSGRSMLAGRIGERLAQCLANCPRHERGRYSDRIAAVQRRIQSPFTLGVEREFEELLGNPATADSLGALERIIANTGQHEGPAETSGVRAVLVLTRAESRASPL